MTRKTTPPRVTLSSGPHEFYVDGMCAMEYADYLERKRRGISVAPDDTLSDRHECICPTIGVFVRSWNDALRTDEERTRLLEPLVPLTLNTAGSDALRARRGWMALDWLVRKSTATWLSLAGFDDLASKLRELPVIDNEDTLLQAHAMVAEGADAITPAASSILANAGAEVAVAAAGTVSASLAADDGVPGASGANTRVGITGHEAATIAMANVPNAVMSTVEELQQSAAILLRRMCEERE